MGNPQPTLDKSTSHTHINMYKQLTFIAVALVCSVLSQDDIQEPFGLSSGAFNLFGNVDSSFSCEGRIYGFYANEELNCQIFHVCEPLEYPDGRTETVQYNFFCPNQTQFDQSLLVCNHVTDAIPCNESGDWLYRNEEFGILPEQKK